MSMTHDEAMQKIVDLEAEVLELRARALSAAKMQREIPTSEPFDAQGLIDKFPGCSVVSLLHRAFRIGKRAR